jgi:hypothetical protein
VVVAAKVVVDTADLMADSQVQQLELLTFQQRQVQLHNSH